MNFEGACNYIINLQSSDLSKDLYYHNIDHVNDVYQAALAIARNENINPHELQLLLTAACYHDVGFLKVIEGHEIESCKIASETLPLYGYSIEDIKSINSMIMATKIPQSPRNLLEEILADADLDYLGRDDFFAIGKKLFQELSHQKRVHTEEEWNIIQCAFLTKHHYFTKTAKQMRQSKKDENLQIIKTKF